MEKRKRSDQCDNGRAKINRGCIEANTLAIIDSSAEFHKDSQDAMDDSLEFLEAVRIASILPENRTPPTKKMVEAVFKILKAGKSMELIISSYELLNEIEKYFPRVYISESSDDGPRELVVIKEAWLPFMVSSDASIEKETNTRKSVMVPTIRKSHGQFDPTGFHELITGFAEMAYDTNSQRLETKFLVNMLLFQYLVNVIEADFALRIKMYKESMSWNFLKESLLNVLLASRRVNYKNLMKDCLHTICGLGQDCAVNNNDSDCENHDIDVPIALLEVQRTTCMAMQKLLIMIMELDMSMQQADKLGLTARSDRTRSLLVEIILDELNYQRNIIPLFLQAFNDPKWKLEIIVRYLLKYTAKLSVRTRRSSGSEEEDSTFCGVLKSFSDRSSAKNIIKKLSAEVVQLLLAHAFLACMSSTSQHHLPSMPDCNEAVIDNSSLVEISKNVAAAFKSLRAADEKIQISSLAKEAIFSASLIISTS